jgi:predicted DNA-binding transcriptional regulator YafY
MTLFEAIDRIDRIHRLIQMEATGNADEFAERIHLKKRHLYNIIEEFKSRGADIQYNREKLTYYYANEFDIQIKIVANQLSIQIK